MYDDDNKVSDKGHDEVRNIIRRFNKYYKINLHYDRETFLLTLYNTTN